MTLDGRKLSSHNFNGQRASGCPGRNRNGSCLDALPKLRKSVGKILAHVINALRHRERYSREFKRTAVWQELGELRRFAAKIEQKTGIRIAQKENRVRVVSANDPCQVRD
jgi:hypothetical protein